MHNMQTCKQHTIQVLSTNVANGFATMRKLQIMTVGTEETERFCRIFDKFFDIFNTRVIEENIRKKKPNLKPFYGDDDSRLKVSISAFLMDSAWLLLCHSGWRKICYNI